MNALYCTDKKEIAFSHGIMDDFSGWWGAILLLLRLTSPAKGDTDLENQKLA